MDTRNKETRNQVAEGKVFAILAYFSILCIIPLILKKDNDFVLFHGRQGLVIFVGEVAVFIMSVVMPWIFRPGMFILLVLSFFGFIAVLKGHYLKLPIIAEIAGKIIL